MGTTVQNNHELERKILICLTSSSVDDKMKELCFLRVTPEYFYKPIHRELYAYILDCYNSKKSYDVIELLVYYRLDTDMHLLLHSFIQDSMQNVYLLYETDIDKLINTYTLTKKLNDTNSLIQRVSKNNNELEALQELSSGLADIVNFEVNQKSGLLSVQDAVSQLMYSSNQNDKIKTGTNLDNFIGGGFMPGSLASFIAQPRMGKTFFSIYLFDAILTANPDTRGLFFSLEMPIEQIIQRHTALKGKRIYECLSDEQKHQAFTGLMMMDYKICDAFTSPKSTDLEYICNYARIEAAQNPISVIVIDYMTKIDTRRRFDRDDLKYKFIASELANLAIELKCVIINLMHSNRTPAERPPNDRCPQLTDEVQSTGAGTSSGYFFGIDRPELHIDSDDWKREYKNLFVLACRKSRFCPEFTLATNFNSGLFGNIFGYYSPKPMNKKSPNDY